MSKITHINPSNGRRIIHLCQRDFDQVEWGDDRASVWYNNAIHTFGVALKTVTSGDTHIVSDDQANIITRFTFPTAASPAMTARAGIKPSMILGYPVAFGGVATALGNVDIWGYDETIAGRSSGSWFRINADFTGDIGNRTFPFTFESGGVFYVGAGQQSTTMYKTTNFTTWTACAALPTDLQNLAAAGACVFKGDAYVAGGSTAPLFGTSSLYNGTLPGHVYKYNIAGDSWTKVVNADDNFKRFWCALAANDKYMYFIQGHVRDVQAGQFPPGFITGDQLGIMITEDGINWSYLDNPPPRNHTTSMVVLPNGDVHGICGSYYNGHYVIKRN